MLTPGMQHLRPLHGITLTTTTAPEQLQQEPGTHRQGHGTLDPALTKCLPSAKMGSGDTGHSGDSPSPSFGGNFSFRDELGAAGASPGPEAASPLPLTSRGGAWAPEGGDDDSELSANFLTHPEKLPSPFPATPGPDCS